jgi:hypothetical protein
MRFHRAIGVLTLITFLHLAVGCSTRTTWPIHSDPGDENPEARALKLGAQPIEIVGYTDRDGEHHIWEGEVRAVLPDSLEFTLLGKGLVRPEPRVKRVHRLDVVSIERSELDGTRTTWLVLGVALVVAVGVAAAVSYAEFQKNMERMGY